MLILGASLPVVVLTLAALVLILWGWAVNMRHVRAVGRMIVWLETHRAEARRLARRSLVLVLAGAACLALLMAGIAALGWQAG